MYSEAKKNFSHHGIMVSDVAVDLGKMMEQKQGAITGLTKGIEGLFKKNKAHSPVGLPASLQLPVHPFHLGMVRVPPLPPPPAPLTSPLLPGRIRSRTPRDGAS